MRFEVICKDCVNSVGHCKIMLIVLGLPLKRRLNSLGTPVNSICLRRRGRRWLKRSGKQTSSRAWISKFQKRVCD